MSNAIFPLTSLPGLSIEVEQDIEFATMIQGGPAGFEHRVGQRFYPMYTKKLRFNFLRDDSVYPELRLLAGFYLSRQGPLDSFLFSDPDDNAVTEQVLGTGTGALSAFQLLRSYGTFIEPVFNPNIITNVFVNGSPVTYTLGANGVITTTTPPANGTTVTCTYSYYFRCRFLEDRLNIKKFLHRVWSGQSVPILCTLQDKIK